MKFSSNNRRKLAGVFALVGAVSAFAAAQALADPPNYPRYLAPAQVAPTHVPEIVAGISSRAAAAQPARVPEIVSGISSPVSTAQPVPLVQPDGSGFNWNDAGIGAGAVFAAVLLAAGFAAVLRRRASLAH